MIEPTINKGLVVIQTTTNNIILILFVVLLLLQCIFGVKNCIEWVVDCVVPSSSVEQFENTIKNTIENTSENTIETTGHTFVLHHIPRTGGTTAKHHLEYLLGNAIDNNTPQNRLIVKHPPFNLYSANQPNSHAIIVVRNPVELKLSQFYNQPLNTTAEANEDFIQSDITLETFVQNPAHQNTITKMLLGIANTTSITKPMFDGLLTILDKMDCSLLVTDYLEDCLGIFENKYNLHLEPDDDLVFSYNTSCYPTIQDFLPTFIESITRFNQYDDQLYKHILNKLPLEQYRKQRPKQVNYIAPQDIPDVMDESVTQIYQQDQLGGKFKLNDTLSINDIVLDPSTDAPMTKEREKLAKEYTELEQQTQNEYMEEINAQNDKLTTRSIYLLMAVHHYAFPLSMYCPVVEFYTTYATMLHAINSRVRQLGNATTKQEAIMVWLHELKISTTDSQDVLLLRLHENAQMECNQGPCGGKGTNRLQTIANIINKYYGYPTVLHQLPFLKLQNVPSVTNELEFEMAIDQAT